MVLLIAHFLNMHVLWGWNFSLIKVYFWGVHLANHYLICFQTNCTVRDQLLSFYVKNVFSRLEVGSDKLYFISAFQVLQANMDACVSIFLRVKLTLSISKVRKGLHLSFSADGEAEGDSESWCDPCHRGPNFLRASPLGPGKFNTIHSLPEWSCGECARWWRSHGDKPLPYWWCYLLLPSHH